MVKQLLSLSEEVTDRLDGERNKSALVDVLLHQHFAIPINSDAQGAAARLEILGHLKNPPAREPEAAAVESPASAQTATEPPPTILDEPEGEIDEDFMAEPEESTLPDSEIQEIKVRYLGQPPSDEPKPLPSEPLAVGKSFCPTCGNEFIPPTCLTCI